MHFHRKSINTKKKIQKYFKGTEHEYTDRTSGFSTLFTHYELRLRLLYSKLRHNLSFDKDEGATGNLKVYTDEVQLKNFCHEVEGSFHPRTCSAEWLLMADDDASSSIGEVEPQPPPDSAGSMTLTEPSAKPTANWFCTCGFAAMTSGYRSSVLQYSTPHD